MKLSLFLFCLASLFMVQISFAGECEDKYPPEKIIKEQIIETPYEVVIETPVKVAYWVTVKKPYQITETCIKKVAKDIWKKPWKLLTVWVDVPYQCARTIYKDVKEKRFKTEFKKEVVTKVKKTVKKIEEYKRPAAYFACLTEKAVHDSRDFMIEVMTGEDPDEVQAEIRKMLAECQARTAELDKIEKYLRAEENFSRNGGHFEKYMGPVAALATKIGGPYGAAASLAVYGIYAGMDHKMKELKKEYESTVAVCQESYNKKLEEVQAVAVAQERKMAVNRNKILAKIDELQAKIDIETDKKSLKVKEIIEEYLDRSVTDEEFTDLVLEHQNIVQDELDKLDVVISQIVNEINSYYDILSNPESLLNYDGE